MQAFNLLRWINIFFLASCIFCKFIYLCIHNEKSERQRLRIDLIARIADVAKLVDALDLGSRAARPGGSSPSIRTITEPSITQLTSKAGKRLGVFKLINI